MKCSKPPKNCQNRLLIHLKWALIFLNNLLKHLNGSLNLLNASLKYNSLIINCLQVYCE